MFTKQLYFLIGAITLAFSSSCIKQDSKDSSYEENFNLLWEIVDEKYCFFVEKGINWEEKKEEYFPLIHEEMSEYEFFDVCGEILDELQDGHVGIASPFNTHYYSSFYLDHPQNYNENIITRHYLKDKPIILGGMRAQNIEGIGYIHYGSFMNLLEKKDLEAILEQLDPIEGLIIDIRNNGGGYTSMADSISSWFLREKTLIVGYNKYKEGPGHNEFSKFLKRELERPGDTIAYVGNVVLLTNRNTYSAANLCASMMQAIPEVILMGDTTGGGGGTPSGSELYNGWRVWLSTNPSFNANKKSIENGVAPDILVGLTKEDELKNKDTIIEEAIRLLKDKANN